MKRWIASAALLATISGCGSLGDYMPSVTIATPPAASPPASYPPSSGREDVVDRVVDGDTIDVQPGKGGSVRILGIDTPETVDPRKPVQCGGPEASAWAKAELPKGTTVLLVPDTTQDTFDYHGRELAYVEYQKNGEWVDYSVEAARAGMARSYVYDNIEVDRHDLIAEAEAEARSAGRGLWGHC